MIHIVYRKPTRLEEIQIDKLLCVPVLHKTIVHSIKDDGNTCVANIELWITNSCNPKDYDVKFMRRTW